MLRANNMEREYKEYNKIRSVIIHSETKLLLEKYKAFALTLAHNLIKKKTCENQSIFTEKGGRHNPEQIGFSKIFGGCEVVNSADSAYPLFSEAFLGQP